ncbi:MAG: polyphosphate kinase 1 [Ignavibacteria bacterium]|nr:polyphosphate kinase 1 [Ignavibacteria bacterium]
MTNFYNRELSWLSFNYRVLQEAKYPSVPLYERIKFLAIYSSNLDEFFRVRVASLRSLLSLKKKTKKELDFSPEELLKQIHKTVNRQQEEFGKIYREQIVPQLEQNKIFVLNERQLLPRHKDYLTDFFNRELKPYLQPILLDKRIETFLQNKVIYIAVRLKNLESSPGNEKKKKRFRYALIEVPSRTDRFIILPEVDENKSLIFLDDVIKIFLPDFFPGYEIESSFTVKLTRDAELYIDDEFAGDLLDKIKKSLGKRNTGVPSRFLYDAQMPKDFLKYLRNCIRLNKDDLIPGGRYHNYNDFFSFPNLNGKELENEPMIPHRSKILDKYNSILKAVSEQDILLHFPYQSYEYIIKFIDEAAKDPDVKSIYITLYRVASGSQIIKALSKASANGKKVTAFVEVKARFDEESNFSSAEELQRAGVKVHYSFPGLKVHSKVCLVSRLENEQKVYYGYFSTGNFNEKTAKIYSDYGLFTKDERLTKEARKVFDILTKKKEKENFIHLLTAPFNLRSALEELIDKEIENAKAGKKAYIILKINSLEDRKMIKLLYKASQAGVKITLIIRGICSLIPNKNIKVISIVDRFLEHSRVFIFGNDGNEKMYVSSADWMTRNLDRRIEVCFPVYSEEIKKQIREMINIQLKDNVKARIINKFQNNKYRKTKSSKKIRAQYEIYNYLNKINSVAIIKSV